MGINAEPAGAVLGDPAGRRTGLQLIHHGHGDCVQHTYVPDAAIARQCRCHGDEAAKHQGRDKNPAYRPGVSRTCAVLTRSRSFWERSSACDETSTSR